MRPGWSVAMLNNFYQKRAIDLMTRDCKKNIKDVFQEDLSEEENEEVIELRKRFHQYSTWVEVEDNFHWGKPLSVCLLKDGTLCCMVGKGLDEMVPIEIKEHEGVHVGLHYFKATPVLRKSNDSIPSATEIAEEAPIVVTAMLLPRLQSDPFSALEVESWTLIGSKNEKFNAEGRVVGVLDAH